MIKSDIGAEFKQTTKGKPSYFHKPVLLKETIEYLKVQKGKWYIDATLGGGGYAFEIIKQSGKVLGIDLDDAALEYVNNKVKSQSRQVGTKVKIGEELILVQGNFRDIDNIKMISEKTLVTELFGKILYIDEEWDKWSEASKGYGPIRYRIKSKNSKAF